MPVCPVDSRYSVVVEQLFTLPICNYMEIAVIQCPVVPVECSTLVAVVQNSAAPSEGEISSIIIQVPVVPVYCHSLVTVISLAVGPVQSQLAIVPLEVSVVPVKSWVLVIAIQKLTPIEVNLRIRTAVANRLAIAVVTVVSTDLPVVRELRRQLVNFC